MSDYKGNQKAVVEHEKGNILVSASAGSGKTYTMISRAIRLIKEGKTTVSNILALTFTESAALEMKEKLKKALFELVEKDDAFIDQISDLDCADISTLHSFCGRIVRSYFFVSGVSPDFRILDADEATLYQKTAIDNLFKKLYDLKEPYFLELLSHFRQNRKDDNLKELVIKLYESARVEPNADEILGKFETLYTKDGLDQTVLKVKEYYDDRANAILDELQWALDVFRNSGRTTAIEVTSRLIEDILDTLNNDYYSLEKYKGYSLFFMPSPFGSKLTEEEALARETVKGAKDKFISLIERFTKDITDRETMVSRLGDLSKLSKDLSTLTKAFFSEYESVKQDENALDFSDLEHYAIKTLKDESVREEIKNKYDYVFVDEYQDTNSVQELIVSLIGNDNLFMVGDDKQSIYGFRGCRPEIFLDKEKNYSSGGGGTALRLNHNFRSAKNILDAVNQIFAFSMTKEHYGYSYLKNAMLISGGIYPEEATGRAEFHLLDTSLSVKEKKEKENVKIYDLKEEYKKLISNEDEDDVNSVALLVSDIIEKEYKNTFYDIKEKKFRSVCPSDVVILSRSVDTKYIQKLVSTLYRLGVPVSSKVSVNALDFQETKVLVKFLELLENQKLDLPLITVMKSVIGDFTENELYDMVSLYANSLEKGKKRDACFYDAYVYALNNAQGEMKDKLNAFEKYIRECRVLKDFIGAKGILDKVVEDSNMFSAILTQKDGKTVAQMVEFFISKALNGDKVLSVAEFLDKVNRADKSFKVETSVGEQAVRIMTIHASKGLEFPVVITIGLEKKSNTTDEEKEILFSKENGFITKFYNASTMLKEETPFRLLTKETLRENRLKEELRLFYVALTRASYSLHMIAKCKGDPRKDVFSGGERYVDYIPSAFPVSIRKEAEFEFNATRHEARKVLVGKVNNEDKDRIREYLEFTYKYLESINVPLKTSVTSAALIKDKSLVDETDVKEESAIITVGTENDSGEIVSNLSSAEKGTIAHRILEHYDFALGDIKTQVENMIKSGVLTKKEADSVSVDRLERAISTHIFSVVNGKTLYREVPFFANFSAKDALCVNAPENVLIQGIIDLLAVDGKDAIIIDYKYSRLDKDKLKEKYQKQLCLYEKAVSSVLGLSVIKKYLFNIYSGEVVEL